MELKKFVVNPVQVNCYLIWDESKEALLIDCAACSIRDRRSILEFITSNGLTIKHHLNTHLHFDHILGNAFVEETFGIKSEANDADWSWAEHIKERAARFGVKYEETVPALGRILNEGDEVTFGTHRIKVIAVPGHSPGSLVFYIPEENVLFSGDTIFHGSIGRTDFPDSDHYRFITEIRNKLLTLPEETIVYPGHDRETTIGFEKAYNMYLR